MCLWCGYISILKRVRVWILAPKCSCFFFHLESLCLDLGSTMSLCYLWSLRDTLLHFMTQLSRRSLSSLGGAPFVWLVRKKISCIFCQGYLCCCWQLLIFAGLEVGPQLLEDVVEEFPRFLCWMPKNCLSTLPKRPLKAWQMMIDGLNIEDVSFMSSFIGGSFVWFISWRDVF